MATHSSHLKSSYMNFSFYIDLSKTNDREGCKVRDAASVEKYYARTKHRNSGAQEQEQEQTG